MKPVLHLTRKIDIIANPAPKALFEAHTWSEWLAARNKALPTKNGRRKSAAAQGQLSLF